MASRGRESVAGRVMGWLRFSIYGLTVEANAPLPGVPRAAASERPDVRVTLVGDASQAVEPGAGRRVWYTSSDVDGSGVPWLTVWRGTDYCFVYGEGARFSIASDGSTIEAGWRPPLDEADAVSFVLGPVLAFALRLRGAVPLHASGVVVNGEALLFAGPPGAGKSSTVAALGALGHRVLSDDVVPLSLVGGQLVASPGFPRVSVWDDTALAVMGGDTAPLPPWSESYPKRCLDLEDRGIRFFDQKAPVGRIYVLQPRGGDGLDMRPLRPRDALVALGTNTFGSYLLDRDMHAHDFAFLGRAVQGVPVWTLRFTDQLHQLQPACERLAIAARELHLGTGGGPVVSW
ncbi:MAG TPA: hypothetical protein VIY56_02830 [Vicinamibacterales bacterium]